MEADKPVARVFRATARPGTKQALLDLFRTVSRDVVKSKEGLLRLAVYEPIDPDGMVLGFETVWCSLAHVEAAFGPAWKTPHLPPGYAGMIQSCFVEHYFVDIEP